MNKDRYARIEIRPHVAEDIDVVVDYLHPDYKIVHERKALAGDSGLLQLFRLETLDTSFPSFSARWDIRENAVDIDLQGDKKSSSLFKAGKDGYKGHHSTSAGDGVYVIEIDVPNAAIFRGTVKMVGTGIVYLKDDVSAVIEGMKDDFAVSSAQTSESDRG